MGKNYLFNSNFIFKTSFCFRILEAELQMVTYNEVLPVGNTHIVSKLLHV